MEMDSETTPASNRDGFSARRAREILGGLFEQRRRIYWARSAADHHDRLRRGDHLSARAGVFAAADRRPIWWPASRCFAPAASSTKSPISIGAKCGGFTIAWNLLCGIPMLMPSFFYENHIDHHNSHRYGTIRDGEYLPLGAGSRWKLLAFWLQVPLLPIYIFVRLLVITPLSMFSPRLRRWALEHMSSFVINFRHRLDIPANAPRRAWAMLEMACCCRCVVMLGAVAIGFKSPMRLVQLYCLALLTLGLNYIRNMVAHHYRNVSGEEMGYLDQLEDSVNITGGPIFTELFFPLGLRYHALHHLFPALPYHNLGIAHRRLMAQLPPNTLYHQTVYPSFWSVMRVLWTERGQSSAVAPEQSRETQAA